MVAPQWNHFSNTKPSKSVSNVIELRCSVDHGVYVESYCFAFKQIWILEVKWLSEYVVRHGLVKRNSRYHNIPSWNAEDLPAVVLHLNKK